MIKDEKKSDNLGILSRIYHDDKKLQKRFTALEQIKKYFNDPKKVETWLSGAVLFFGIIGIIFGLNHFRNQILSPYRYFPPDQTIDLGQGQGLAPDLLGLRQKDTDQDGLSDYDELNIYNTSPYLEDSDSDGVQDAAEVARGSDPSCPIGQNCFGFYEVGSDQLVTPDNFINPLFTGEANADQLRQLLRQAGMSQQLLDSLSDEQIIETYQQSLTQDLETDQSGQTLDLPVSKIEDLTPQQLRQLLLQAGISVDTLNQISDDELLQLVQETLQQ